MNIRLAAFALALGVLPLAAQPYGHHGTFRKAAFTERMATVLKLTESQKTQIQSIQARHADALKAKAQAAGEAHKAFRDAGRNPETSLDQLKSLHQAKSDKAFELILEHRTQETETRAVLTPEQRAEWDRFLAYRQGMKNGRGRGPHGMGS